MLRLAESWPSRRRLTALWLVAVALVCLAVWGRVLALPFTDVDTLPLILTGRVHSWSDLERVVGQPLMQGRMVNGRFWRPVTSLSYGLDEALWGLEPFGYHLTDLLLHTANTLLLWWLVVQLWRLLWPQRERRGEGWAVAALASLLFALHPVHVETVPAIARRAELLLGLFVLVALLGTARRLQGGGVLAVVTASVACALAIGTKEAGFVTPVLCLLAAVVLAPPSQWRRPWRAGAAVAPLFGVAVVVLALRTAVLGGLGGYAVADFPLWRRAALSLAHHVLGLTLPGLSQLWGGLEETVRSMVGAHPWLALGCLGLALFEAVRVARALPWQPADRRAVLLLVGCPIAIFALHLTSVFVPRYLYVTTLFFCVLLSWGLVRGVRARGLSRPLHLFRLGWVGATGALAASLLATSPLVLDGPLDKWRLSAGIAREFLESTEQAVRALPPGSRVGLVNLPYEVQTGHPLPVAPILLEHSVQAWLDLRRPEQRLAVVGLTYCTVDAREQDSVESLPRIWVVIRQRPDRRLHVRVLAAGEASRFPWDYRYVEPPEGRLYRVVGPPRGPSLDLDLLGDGWGAEPFFVVYLGDRVESRRGWEWTALSSNPLG